MDVDQNQKRRIEARHSVSHLLEFLLSLIFSGLILCIPSFGAVPAELMVENIKTTTKSIDGDRFSVHIEVDLVIRNRSSRSIFVVCDTMANANGLECLEIVDVELFEFKINSSERTSLGQLGVGRSKFTSPEIERFERKLAGALAPKSMTIEIQPWGSLEIRRSFDGVINKRLIIALRQSADCPPGLIATFRIETFPQVLKFSTKGTTTGIEEKIQKRWAKFGTVLTNELNSEPAFLQLGEI